MSQHSPCVARHGGVAATASGFVASPHTQAHAGVTARLSGPGSNGDATASSPPLKQLRRSLRHQHAAAVTQGHADSAAHTSAITCPSAQTGRFSDTPAGHVRGACALGARGLTAPPRHAQLCSTPPTAPQTMPTPRPSPRRAGGSSRSRTGRARPRSLHALGAPSTAAPDAPKGAESPQRLELPLSDQRSVGARNCDTAGAARPSQAAQPQVRPSRAHSGTPAATRPATAAAASPQALRSGRGSPTLSAHRSASAASQPAASRATQDTACGSECSSGHRRSGRARVAPVAFWQGECSPASRQRVPFVDALAPLCRSRSGSLAIERSPTPCAMLPPPTRPAGSAVSRPAAVAETQAQRGTRRPGGDQGGCSPQQAADSGHRASQPPGAATRGGDAQAPGVAQLGQPCASQHAQEAAGESPCLASPSHRPLAAARQGAAGLLPPDCASPSGAQARADRAAAADSCAGPRSRTAPASSARAEARLPIGTAMPPPPARPPRVDAGTSPMPRRRAPAPPPSPKAGPAAVPNQRTDAAAIASSRARSALHPEVAGPSVSCGSLQTSGAGSTASGRPRRVTAAAARLRMQGKLAPVERVPTSLRPLQEQLEDIAVAVSGALGSEVPTGDIERDDDTDGQSNVTSKRTPAPPQAARPMEEDAPAVREAPSPCAAIEAATGPAGEPQLPPHLARLLACSLKGYASPQADRQRAPPAAAAAQADVAASAQAAEHAPPRSSRDCAKQGAGAQGSEQRRATSGRKRARRPALRSWSRPKRRRRGTAAVSADTGATGHTETGVADDATTTADQDSGEAEPPAEPAESFDAPEVPPLEVEECNAAPAPQTEAPAASQRSPYDMGAQERNDALREALGLPRAGAHNSATAERYFAGGHSACSPDVAAHAALERMEREGKSVRPELVERVQKRQRLAAQAPPPSRAAPAGYAVAALARAGAASGRARVAGARMVPAQVPAGTAVAATRQRGRPAADEGDGWSATQIEALERAYNGGLHPTTPNFWQLVAARVPGALLVALSSCSCSVVQRDALLDARACMMCQRAMWFCGLAGKSAAECYQRVFEPMAPRAGARAREAALPQAAPPPERTAAGNAATAAQKRRWQRDMRWALQASKADSNARALELEVRRAMLGVAVSVRGGVRACASARERVVLARVNASLARNNAHATPRRAQEEMKAQKKADAFVDKLRRRLPHARRVALDMHNAPPPRPRCTSALAAMQARCAHSRAPAMHACGVYLFMRRNRWRAGCKGTGGGGGGAGEA